MFIIKLKFYYEHVINIDKDYNIEKKLCLYANWRSERKSALSDAFAVLHFVKTSTHLN